MANDLLVSFCIIAYNEQKNIVKVFEDVCKQDYPHDKIEIILVNSHSTDRTLEVMKNFAAKNKNDFYNIRVVTNQGHNQASGWNTAIKNAVGDIIIRVDAHASVPENFVSKNVETIKSGEYICGGARPNIIIDSTQWKETLLLAETSMFGSNIASYRRTTNEKKYVNSLFHGAYRREVFEKCGGFNENLGRTEDNELHYRIRKNGYRLCFSPEIISYQNIRSDIWSMIKQKFSNGKWIGLTIAEEPRCLSLFHFIPFVFVLAIIASIALTIFFGISIPLIILLCLYFIADIGMSILAVKNKKFNPTYLALPFIFLVLHLSYGFGTLIGILISPFWHLKLSDEAYKEIQRVKDQVTFNRMR